MADENIYSSAPVLDEIEYVETARKTGPQGVTAPVLDDIDFTDSVQKKGAPKGVSAPVLDDMSDFIDTSQRKGAPTGVSAPVLDDMSDFADTSQRKGAPKGVSAPVLDSAGSMNTPSSKLIMSDEDIVNGLSPEQKAVFDGLPSEKQQQVIEMRRTQLGAEAPPPKVTAPVLDDDNYVPPVKEEKPAEPQPEIKAPVLDEEPETPKYVPKYVDEDLERAKIEGAKKARESALTSNQKDSKESLRMMLELKEQQQAEMAEKGFKMTIVLAVAGIISAVAFYLLYSGKLGLPYKEGIGGFAKVVEEASMYIAVIIGILSCGLVSGIGAVKSLASFAYLLFGIIQVFPGVTMIPQHEGNLAVAGILYGVAIAGTVFEIVSISGNESVGLYFKRKG